MERKCERPSRACVVENGILKYMPVTSVINIPSEVKIICGVKEQEDKINNKYGEEPVFYNCFMYNEKIKEINCPDSIEVIGEKAFEHCHSLEKFNFVKTDNGPSLKRIGLSAFLGCESLKKIKLPNTLKEIDEWAFCLISDLVIEFDGTLEEWNNIKKCGDWCSNSTLLYTKDNPEKPIIINGK